MSEQNKNFAGGHNPRLQYFWIEILSFIFSQELTIFLVSSPSLPCLQIVLDRQLKTLFSAWLRKVAYGT